MKVFIVCDCYLVNTETTIIKKVFAKKQDAFDYLNEAVKPLGVAEWKEREEPDIDYHIARVDVRRKAVDEIPHYYKVYEMEVKGIE